MAVMVGVTSIISGIPPEPLDALTSHLRNVEVPRCINRHDVRELQHLGIAPLAHKRTVVEPQMADAMGVAVR